MCVNVLAKAFSKFQPTGVLSAVLRTGSAFPRETLAIFYELFLSRGVRGSGVRQFAPGHTVRQRTAAV